MKRKRPRRTIDLDIALPSEDHGELLVDEALLESFPASDPPAPAVDASAARARAKRPKGDGGG
jgi:hypothetical protein